MPATDLDVRPPKQERSRQAWRRVLDAGVGILEDGGYDAFTIARVCERAGVAATAVYARTTSKDALFLAVYEHGVARLQQDQAVFDDPDRWTGLGPVELVQAAVGETVGIALRHRRFLRSVVLVSASHEEVRRRGSGYSRQLGEGFAAAVLGCGRAIRHEDPVGAVQSIFGTVFAAAMIRVAYGPGFATPQPLSDEVFTDQLAETAVRYLLGSLGT